MTPVEKGDLGEMAVALEIMKQGFQVFKPLGNGTRIDFIVMAERFLKVQVKYCSSNGETAKLELRKTTLNPKYNYTYNKDDVDIFALYVADRETVLFITSEEVFSGKSKPSMVSFRFSPAKNNQVKGTKMSKDYLTFPAGA